MKWLQVTFCLVLTTDIFAQEKLFLINPGQSIIQSIPVEDKYAYREFVSGSVHYKKAKLFFKSMNYNILMDEMEYINSRKDTVAIPNTNFDFVVIASDTFYHDRFYYKVLKDYGKVRLLEKKSFGFAQIQKTGSQPRISFQAIMNARFLNDTAPKDTLRLAKFDLYYISDVKNQIWQLLEQNLLKIYSYKKKELSNYLLEHPVNFYNRLQVEELLDFLNAKRYN